PIPAVVVKNSCRAGWHRSKSLQTHKAEKLHCWIGGASHLETVRRKTNVERLGVRSSPGVEVEGFYFTSFGVPIGCRSAGAVHTRGVRIFQRNAQHTAIVERAFSPECLPR